MEDMFPGALLDRWDQEMSEAAERIQGVLSLTPPSLVVKEAANFLGATHNLVNHGRACDLFNWILVADVLVNFHNGLGYQRVSDDFVLPTLPHNFKNFKIEWRAKFNWGDKHYESALSPIGDLIEALRLKTMFGDVVIFTALRDLFLRVLNLYYNLSNFLDAEIRSRYGADGWFLFDRARYYQSVEDVTARNKNTELKKDKNVLEEIANGLKESKQFAKSKLLASLRGKCEGRIHELDFIIPGELIRGVRK